MALPVQRGSTMIILLVGSYSIKVHKSVNKKTGGSGELSPCEEVHCKKRCVVPSRYIYVQLFKQLATIFTNAKYHICTIG